MKRKGVIRAWKGWVLKKTKDGLIIKTCYAPDGKGKVSKGNVNIWAFRKARGAIKRNWVVM